MGDALQLSDKVPVVPVHDNAIAATCAVKAWSEMIPNTLSDRQVLQSNLMQQQGFLDFGVGDPLLIAQGTLSRNDQNVAGLSPDDAWLLRREQLQANYDNDLAQHIRDAVYTPRDGQVWPLLEFLTRAHSPITDSFELSKHLKDDQPGKSKTLEDTMDRLQHCPWGLSIRVDSTGRFSDYSNPDSMINLNPKHSQGKQIDEFVHEAYHATHQFLNTLWGGERLDKQSYVNTYVWGEVNAMLQEVKVRNELGLKEPVTYNYIRPDGKPDTLYVGEYVSEHGTQALFDFLYSAQPANKGEKPYGDHYAGNYENYKNNFDQDKRRALPLIQSWVDSGHRADDI